MPSKKLRTVEDVFLDDAKAKTNKGQEIWENIRRAYPEDSVKFDKAKKAISTTGREPETYKLLDSLEAWTDDWRKNAGKIAEILKVNIEDLESYEKLDKAHAKEYEKRVSGPRKALWKRMVKKSPITVINRETFPGDDQRPFIVFYSADWCGPCQAIKPAYLKLSLFFDKARLFYYAADEIFKERPEIKFVPQLVAYLPNGSTVHSGCGGSAKKLWDNMNLMLTLGENFNGTGELVCTETECRIQPLATAADRTPAV